MVVHLLASFEPNSTASSNIGGASIYLDLRSEQKCKQHANDVN